MRSEAEVPIAVCLTTATICSTLKRFIFTAYSLPFPEASMPETLFQIGSKIRGLTNRAATLNSSRLLFYRLSVVYT